MFCLLVKHYLKVHFKELFKSFNHKHDLLYFNNMVWISETHRLNCRMSVCWKSSATTHAQLLASLHYAQGSSFFFPFCTFRSCWAICYTDTCLRMRSKRLIISWLVSKIYCISLIVCKTIKHCEQYCKQQLVNIILVINWLILAPLSMYIFVITNIVLLLYVPSQQLWSWRDGQFT